jgi:hypothetical protein
VQSISTEIAAAVMANLRSLRPAPVLSLSFPPSVNDELVSVLRQLKRKVDHLTHRSATLEALVGGGAGGGAAPRKKRAVKGRTNKAQLTPAVGKENGGARPQKPPGKERAHVEGDEGGGHGNPWPRSGAQRSRSPAARGRRTGGRRSVRPRLSSRGCVLRLTSLFCSLGIPQVWAVTVFTQEMPTPNLENALRLLLHNSLASGTPVDDLEIESS